jgi:heat shock protein HslJ
MLQGREMSRQNLPGGSAALSGKNWQPLVIAGERIPSDNTLFVHFAVDGSVHGNSGCNQFSGSLETTETGIAMGNLVSTRKACPPAEVKRESAFMNALQSTERLQLNLGTLQLLDAEGAPVAELIVAE